MSFLFNLFLKKNKKKDGDERFPSGDDLYEEEKDRTTS
jgi:hypothetical protein